MAYDDDEDFAGGEDLGGGTERAFNDVALSIGFSMMVLLLVVVSSMTALQNIAVNLPETDSASSEDGPAKKTPVVVVSLEATPDGALHSVHADEARLDIDASWPERLAELYGDALADAGTVALHIRADGDLSHATVSEAVFRLNAAFRSLGGVSRKVTVRYVARQAGLAD